MKQEEAYTLCEAISTWLAYRSRVGFEKFLSEGMLALPIAEFLASRHWNVRQELSYRKLPNANGLPDIWCDFAGTRQYSKGIDFILETKFLKEKSRYWWRQIAADIIRLSLPPDKRVKRIFVLAGHKKHFPGTSDRFPYSDIFALDVGKGYNLRTKDALSDAGVAKAFPYFDKQKISSAIYMRRQASSDAPSGEDGYKAKIWTVTPTN